MRWSHANGDNNSGVQMIAILELLAMFIVLLLGIAVVLS